MPGPDLSRWTPFVWAMPKQYIDEDYDWAAFDLEQWSEDEYTWDKDPWYGIKDFAQPVEETIETGRGDCEDYALVALSARHHDGATKLGLGFMFDTDTVPPQGHVVAYDADHVYSSGVISEQSLDPFVNDSDYDVLSRRPVR